MTDQLPSVADFLVAVSSVSTQGQHTPALKDQTRSDKINYNSVYRGSYLAGLLHQKSGLSRGVASLQEINTFLFRFTLSSGLSGEVGLSSDGLSKEVPLYILHENLSIYTGWINLLYREPTYLHF